jgi:hypothetical protein
MKVKVWYCIVGNGDGSYTSHFFPTKEEAEAYEEKEISSLYYEGPTDAVDFEIIDTENYFKVRGS